MSSTAGILDEPPPPRSPSAYFYFSSDISLSAVRCRLRSQNQPATLEEREKEAVKAPIQSRVPTHQVAPEERSYEAMMSHEMSNCCHEMPHDDFMFFCANSAAFKDVDSGLSEQALKKMSKCTGLVPFKEYENSKELITIVYHTLIGHENAWTKAKILHSDIYSSNIMFVIDQDQETTVNLHGILNDWDLCKRQSKLSKECTRSGRSGTWAFMSGSSLRWPLKPYQLSDDIEAFIHVVTFCCLRFHWHSRTAIPLCDLNDNGTVPDEKELYGINSRNTELGSYMSSYYDACDPGHLNGIGIDTGGERKIVLAKFGTFDWSFLEGLAPQPLILLVAELCGLLQTRYGELDFVELHNKYSGRRRIARIPRPRRAANSHSPSSDGPSGATQRAQEGTAPAKADVSIWACKNDTLDCHSRIKAIFEEAIEAFRVPEASFKDKTPDQFLGLSEYHGAAP